MTATGDETALAGIMRLVEQAQQSKSRTQVLADKAAGWLFYVALGVAAITAVAWIDRRRVQRRGDRAGGDRAGDRLPARAGAGRPAGGGHHHLAWRRATASWCATGWRWRRRGEIDTVIFDKTGTLTEGEFGVVGMATADGWDEDEALALAAAVEGDSEHTIARGIRQARRRARAGAAAGDRL